MSHICILEYRIAVIKEENTADTVPYFPSSFYPVPRNCVCDRRNKSFIKSFYSLNVTCVKKYL